MNLPTGAETGRLGTERTTNIATSTRNAEAIRRGLQDGYLSENGERAYSLGTRSQKSRARKRF